MLIWQTRWYWPSIGPLHIHFIKKWRCDRVSLIPHERSPVLVNSGALVTYNNTRSIQSWKSQVMLFKSLEEKVSATEDNWRCSPSDICYRAVIWMMCWTWIPLLRRWANTRWDWEVHQNCEGVWRRLAEIERRAMLSLSVGLNWEGMVWQRLSFATATSDMDLKSVPVDVVDSIIGDS